MSYYEDNKDLVKERAKAWAAANRERRLAIQKKDNAKRRERTHELYLLKRAEKIERATKWKEDNRERSRKIQAGVQARRRAQELSTLVDKVDYSEILRRDGLSCHICGDSVPAHDVHFDHVVPLSKGGHHVEENIRVAHSRCNMSKAAKLLVEHR